MSGLLWSILGFIVLAAAWIVSMRSSAKKPVEALLYVGAFMTVFISVVGLVVFVLPTGYEALVEDALPMFWGPVLGNTGDDIVDAAYTAADYVNYNGRSNRIESQSFSASSDTPVETQKNANEVQVIQPVLPAVSVQTNSQISEPEVRYTVQPGDTLKKIADTQNVVLDDLIALNGIADPNRISVGQDLLIKKAVVVEVAMTAVPQMSTVPLPTATPRPNFTREFADIENAKIDGDRLEGINILGSLLDREPDNLRAIAYRDEIEAANELERQWENLNPQALTEAISALSGFSFRAAEIETAFLKTKGEELMTLICNSPGWMNGEEVIVSRLVGANLGFHEVNDIEKIGR